MSIYTSRRSHPASDYKPQLMFSLFLKPGAERAPRLEQTFETPGAVSPKSSASLGCRVSGDPPPSVSWTLDSAWPIVSGGPRLRLWSTSDGVTGDVISFLNWTSVEAGDSGQYVCRATNAAGRVQHAFRLNVRAPLFVRPAYNETALVGATTRLQCPFGGYPFDRVVWYKGEPVDIYPLAAAVTARQPWSSAWKTFLLPIRSR